MSKWENEDSYDNEYNNDNFIFEKDCDEEDESFERENNLIKELDQDLLEYFDDAKLIKKKLALSKQKSKKKDKEIYVLGQKIKCNNVTGSILYGPYEKDTKTMYEVETDKGNIISVEYSNIKKL